MSEFTKEEDLPKHIRLQLKYLPEFMKSMRDSGRSDSIRMMQEVRTFLQNIQLDPKQFPIP